MLRITNTFLDTVKSQLINEIFTHFRPTDESYYNSTDLDLFKVHYNISKINLDNFGMDYRRSSIRFQKEEPNIVIDLVEFRTNLDFEFNLTAEPRFYEDLGEGAVHFEFDEFKLGLGIEVVDGVFQFKLIETQAQLKKDSAGTYFKGSGDLSFILNQASTLLQGQLMQAPTETVQAIVGFILPTINSGIAASGCKADLDVLSFDWCAMDQPQFSDDDLVLIFKGEATPDPDTVFPYPEQRVIPYKFDRSLKDISLFISDYTLNTTLWSAYKNGALMQDIRSMGTNEKNETIPIPASTLFVLFPELAKHVEEGTNLSILVEATDDMIPSLDITNKETTIDLIAKVSFATLDQAGNRTPFLEVVSNVNVAANFRIDSPFTFKTDISKMRFRADELSLDKFGLTNIADLNSIIGTMSGFVRNFVNRQFSGFRLKEFDLKWVKMNVERTVLKELDRYIYGSMAPRFTSADNAKYLSPEEVVPKFEMKPITYEDQVNAMAELLKFTPLYTSIQEFKKNEHLYKTIGNIGGMGLGLGLDHDDEDAPLPKERIEDYTEAQA